MQMFNQIFTLTIIGAYGWLSFPGMVKNRKFGDLFINLVLIAGILYWQACLLWRLYTPNPSSVLSLLLERFIKLLYGPWL